MEVEKNNTIVNALNKTKEESHPNLFKQQQDAIREALERKKAERRFEEKAKKIAALEEKQKQDELSYDRIMNTSNMKSASEMGGTADESAAEAYEDDFF